MLLSGAHADGPKFRSGASTASNVLSMSLRHLNTCPTSSQPSDVACIIDVLPCTTTNSRVRFYFNQPRSILHASEMYALTFFRDARGCAKRGGQAENFIGFFVLWGKWEEDNGRSECPAFFRKRINKFIVAASFFVLRKIFVLLENTNTCFILLAL